MQPVLRQVIFGRSLVDRIVANWLARAYGTGGTLSASTLTAARQFVLDCKAGGVLPLIKRCNLFCGDFAASMVPLVNTLGNSVDTFTNGVSADYTEALGPQTNGTDKRISFGYTPSELVGGMSCYLRTTQASDSTGRCLMGADSVSGTQSFRLMGNRDATGGSVAGAVKGSWGGSSAASNPATTGGMVAALWHIVRRGATDSELFKNGASVGTSATSLTPASATVPLSLFCLNNNGTFAVFLSSGSRLGAYAIDTGMTAGQAAAFYAAMQAFQTALGRQV